ncbi:hypothetical protein E5358_14135 [Palleniella muris]|uniref:Uncharacterized protein n=1 Tax=Palleniella muris TaxID=3038145 RepID=A0AC61QLS2_9BACT|nr:hypothetical protein [Palleniella muris]TGX79932.1 hypothetical protein E5358_14135 [Palleniella muris]
MEKELIINKIANICKDMGLHYILKAKTALWTADILIECANHKVAINVCKSPRNVEAVCKAMHEEQIHGCWLLLHASKSPGIMENKPCFKIENKAGEAVVIINPHANDYADGTLDLSEFIHAFIDDKIIFTETVTLDKVEICFYKKECYRCHRESSLLLV